MTMPAHLARKNRNQRNRKEWKPPFKTGHTQFNRTLVAVDKLGIGAEDTRYRVTNLVCGHESVISHRRFQDKRHQNGFCMSCASKWAAKRKKEQWSEKRATRTSGMVDVEGATWLDLWRDKKAQELRECLWFHNIWNRSLGMS